jgi:hypothetical protein
LGAQYSDRKGNSLLTNIADLTIAWLSSQIALFCPAPGDGATVDVPVSYLLSQKRPWMSVDAIFGQVATTE